MLRRFRRACCEALSDRPDRRAVAARRGSRASDQARGAAPRSTPAGIVDAILYLVCTGCAWRMLPKVLPPCQTVY
jgi:transposase